MNRPESTAKFCTVCGAPTLTECEQYQYEGKIRGSYLRALIHTTARAGEPKVLPGRRVGPAWVRGHYRFGGAAAWIAAAAFW